MSVKSKIGTAVDVSILVAASVVTVAGAITTFNVIKAKKGLPVIAWSALVTLVGVSAAKYSLQNIRSKKDEPQNPQG